jgi:flagellar basal-body rod protein FlgF
VDRALYVGMTGAMQTLRAQAATSNNLANASTTGFRAQLVEAQAVPVAGSGFASRVNANLADGGWESSGGIVTQTGRDLDIALGENHWLAVQASDGGEAYTRAGDLQIDAYGRLLTGAGQPVLGDAGPLSVPPQSSVQIGADGTVSIIPLGQQPNAPATVGRLKIVEAQPQQLQRGLDGLMRATPGVNLAPAAGSVLTAGALEGSNVDLAGEMVNMINLARTFELQTRVMRAAEDNDSAATALLRIG